jgi:thiol:disulfide interchange protein
MIALCRRRIPPNIATVPRILLPILPAADWPGTRLVRSAAGVLVLIAALLGTRAMAAPPMSELVQAELLAEPPSIVPGQPFWVAVRLRMKAGWHTYWRNPGDSGEAIAIRWQLPPGYEAGPIGWPAPSRLSVAHLVNFGYEGETTLLTEIRPPQALDAKWPIDIAADVSWLVCEKECIPGETRLSIGLPVAGLGRAGEPRPQARATFDAARSAVPQPFPGAARMELAPEWLTLNVTGLPADGIRGAYFFPYTETLAQHAAPQRHEVARDGLTLRIKRSTLSVSPPATADGVLVVEEAQGPTTARRAFELSSIAIGQTSGVTYPAASFATVLQAAALALLGGLILNLMPCVFPVLSIKVLGLIDQAGQSRARVREHGLTYTAGVLVAFAALASLLLAVRAAGAEIGWGFQLQSPAAVATLAYVLFAVGLNLSGVFHLGSSLQGVGNRLALSSGLAGSFGAGVLAAVVATPCTAPFMAAAIGFALTQPAVISFVVFLALGLGLALPFLALTLAPQLISRLPRPGAWMGTLKQLLAFPVYATVAWLVWVLGQQVGPTGLLAALIGLVLVGLAAWSFNFQQTSGSWGRRLALATAAVSIAGAAVAVAGLEQSRLGPRGPEQTASAAGIERFSQQRLDELLASDRPVFVNLTAAWCITCLVNEHTSLAATEVKAAFARKQIAYLKGDWTNRNPEITRVLEKHGRSGVPLYLLYARASEPIILPQILTPATVLEQIDRIGDRPQHKASLSSATKE